MQKPPFYEIVDKAYRLIIDNTSQAIQERRIVIAPVLGAIGSYGVIKSLQWTSKNVVDKVIPGFDEHALPLLEKICMIGITIAPIVYGIVDPETARNIMVQHPTYTTGMFGAYAGCMTAAAQDLHNRKVEYTKLEDVIKK